MRRRLRGPNRARSGTSGTPLEAVARTVERRTTWILGSGRSGTTWLASLLGAITGGIRVDEPLVGAHLAAGSEVVTGVSDPERRLLIETSAERLDYVFAHASSHVWVPVLKLLLEHHFAHVALTKQPSAPLDVPIVVKEPNGSLSAEPLLRAMPGSRLIFLVRDGRDVVDSVLDGLDGGWITSRTGLNSSTEDGRAAVLAVRADEWARTVDAVQRAYDRHDPTRRIRVTYEALRADTTEELARILRWMAVDIERAAVEDIVARMAFDAIPADKKGPGQFARAATPGLWRERFSPSEVAELERRMGPTLVRQGYALSSEVSASASAPRTTT